MTYRLNVCNLSGIFEKSFGLTNFSEDYYALLNSFRGLESAVNDSSYTLSPRTLEEYLEYKDWYQDYRLFCKLSHFVDDFNFFINESVRTRTEHDSKHLVDRRLHDFIRRVESMKIPQQTKDTIAGFLKMQRAKVALVAIRESPWVVPNLLENENLQIIAAKAKNEEVRKRLIMTTQILQTWGKFPELRLGQLISNSLPEGTDLFYVTDDKLIQLLKDFEANNG
jgi:hypothetical protein